MKRIRITIDPNGDPPTIEADGFTGKACLAATLDFERAYGGAKSSKPKPEMAARATATVKQ